MSEVTPAISATAADHFSPLQLCLSMDSTGSQSNPVNIVTICFAKENVLTPLPLAHYLFTAVSN